MHYYHSATREGLDIDGIVAVQLAIALLNEPSENVIVHHAGEARKLVGDNRRCSSNEFVEKDKVSNGGKRQGNIFGLLYIRRRSS